MTVLNIFLSSVFSLLAMFISVKIIGNRQMSELNMYDYINGITIGSIAAEMATALEEDILKPLVAMAVYTLFVFLTSVVTSRFVKIRRFISGKSLMLIDNGKFLPENFKKCKLDLSEFLNQCRVQGYFDPSGIAYAFMEANGRLSFLPKSTERPLTFSDLATVNSGEPLKSASPFITLISDGKILTENLSSCKKDVAWLRSKLSDFKIKSERDVFFACVDKSGTFMAFRREKATNNNDIFQ